jgi:hypothetical protein
MVFGGSGIFGPDLTTKFAPSFFVATIVTKLKIISFMNRYKKKFEQIHKEYLYV